MSEISLPGVIEPRVSPDGVWRGLRRRVPQHKPGRIKLHGMPFRSMIEFASDLLP